MKLLLMFACSLVLGCGIIFGLVHGIVPHLVSPQIFPEARATVAPPAGGLVQEDGARPNPGELLADGR